MSGYPTPIVDPKISVEGEAVTTAAWELVLEAARLLTTRGLAEFTRAQLLDEVWLRDSGRRPESLGPVIQT